MEELLLTTSYFSHDYDDILCVGGSFSNPDTYCARSVAPPGEIRNTIISEVCDLLATISAAPMSSTSDDLYNLATLCLCQSHVSQADMIASEWEQALRNTMQQYHRSSSPSRNSMVMNMDIQRLQQTIASFKRVLANKRAAAKAMAIKSKDQEARLLEETLSWKNNYESLDHETKVAQQTSADKINNLEVKISSLENSFQRDRREISAQRQSLSELRAAKTKLEADVQQSTTQNQTLQTEKIKANDKIESLQGDLRNLQAKIVDLEKSNEFMAIELAAKNLALRGEETRVKELMKVISNLEISETHLKQVIASCWLHRIYNWLTGSRLVL
jgi:chromosome segregation ATPase